MRVVKKKMPNTYGNGRIYEKNIVKKKLQLKMNDTNKDKVILKIDEQIQFDFGWNKYFNNNKINDDNNQNLILFIRGEAIFYESNIKRIKQFSNLLIKNGIIIKRIVKNTYL